MGNPTRNPELFLRRMLSGISAVDQKILSRPEIRRMLMENYSEAMRAGVRGFAREAVILSNSWGFRLEDISIPVDVWHGEEDANVSLSAARHVANTIPVCHATFLPGKGHWLYLEHWEEILSSLLS
jgi:pimeloyl-ACP methyl ester carboxylesterase